MPEMRKIIRSPGVRTKADAVLAAVRAGHRRVDAISAASGLAPTTVLRVAALLRDHRLLDRLPAPGPLEFLPILQRPESGS